MRVTLNGFVVADEDAWIYELFGYKVFSPETIRQAVRDNPEGEELVFEVNSGGGSVFAGFEMYSVIRSAKCATVCEVQSLGASAASTFIQGCNRVLVSPVAQIMIHLPSCATRGDEPEHQQSIKLLRSIKESILNGYEGRSRGRKSRDELSQMMDAETWLTAQEAVDAGVADAVLYEDDANVDPQNIMNSVGAGLRAMVSGSGGLPAANALREEYRRVNGTLPTPPAGDDDSSPAGGDPAVDTDDAWRAEARLAIEKNRF